MKALRDKRLSTEEVEFLLRLLREHRAYYGLLAGSERCGEGNRKWHVVVEELARKLEAMR